MSESMEERVAGAIEKAISDQHSAGGCYILGSIGGEPGERLFGVDGHFDTRKVARAVLEEMLSELSKKAEKFGEYLYENNDFGDASWGLLGAGEKSFRMFVGEVLEGKV